MTTNQDLLKRREAAIVKGLGQTHGHIYAARAENAEVWDVEGKRYIDFAGGIAVLNVGHRHPKVMAAVQEQLQRFTHTCVQVLPYEPYVELAEKLNALVPGGPNKTMFVTTGAEAVENAVKFARAHTRRTGVIAFSGAFHGRTSLCMGLTGKVVPYKAGFGPFPNEIYHAPFPNPLHGVSVEQALAGLQHLLKSEIEPARVAAVIIEPVQGEGGFYIAPPEFLRALRALCDEHGMLLIADEIQSGIGRTGRMLAMEHSGVIADIVTLAKSLAAGFPLAAVTGRAEVMDAAPPGGVGGTYGGNPLACAAALAVLEVMHGEGLIARAEEIGQRMEARLRALAARQSCIGDVRRLGAMLAMELFDGEAPAADLTKAVVSNAAGHGLVILPCGVYGNVIRFLVPLTASDAILDEGLDILERALLEVLDQGAAMKAAG